MSTYKFVVEAERERFMESPLRKVTRHYIVADTYDQAHGFVWGRLSEAGWKVKRISSSKIILQDIRERDNDHSSENMKEKIVIESLENAWRALACQYVDSPDEDLRKAINLLDRMVKEVKRHIEDYEESERKKQERISTQEWLDWLKDAYKSGLIG